MSIYAFVTVLSGNLRRHFIGIINAVRNFNIFCLQVVANGACHSDLWIMEGKAWDVRMQWPIILGHEAAGIVESVGEGVKDFKPGIVVSFPFHDKNTSLGMPYLKYMYKFMYQSTFMGYMMSKQVGN